MMKYLMQELERMKRDRPVSQIFDHISLELGNLGLLPTKFKMLDMEKFNGKGCSMAHVEAYTLAMYAKGVTRDVMAYFFHQTLAGPAREWFMALSADIKGDRRRASEAFQMRYKDNNLYQTT